MRKLFIHHALTALKRVKDNRVYALDDRAKTELGALAVAFRDIELKENGRCDLGKLPAVIEQLAQDLPGLKQQRPGPEEEIEPIPHDSLGQPIANPWVTKNLTDCALIQQQFPRLAAWWKECADNGGQPSLAMIDRETKAKALREKLRTLKYDEATHRNNVFRLSGREGLHAQSAFVNANEPHVVLFFKRETEPVSMNYGNLTVRQKVARRDMQLGHIFERASKIHAQWLKDDVEKLKSLIGTHTTEIQQAEKQLASAR